MDRLEPSDTLHDTDSKILLNGVVLPVGLTQSEFGRTFQPSSGTSTDHA